MTLLAIDWASVGVKAGQLLLSLSILVVLHEFGHYITARWFKCRVEKFYLFFDPWFSVLKKKIGDTEYGIGWLPLGGYVKIAGMIDESMDKEAMALPPKEWEFRSKPAWQRLIIMLGGIIVNVLLAIFIYSMILYKWGDTKIPISSLKNGIYFQDSIYYNIGLRQGDKIISVNNKPVEYLDNLTELILMGETAKLNRDRQEISLQFPVNLLGKLIEAKKKGGKTILPRIPAIIGSFAGRTDVSPAKEAGVKEGDIILAIDSQKVVFYDEIKSILQTKTNNLVTLTIDRSGTILNINSKLTNEKTLGVPPMGDFNTLDSMGYLKIEKKTFGFFESFPAGLALTYSKLVSYINQFKKILSPKTEAYKGLGGFKAIANAFPGVWDWESFWNMTAFLSIVLAFMNLLPIPALDGGHVMFTLYEMITRRKPNEKFLEYAQMAGMIILLLLMVYANANDWLGWGK